MSFREGLQQIGVVQARAAQVGVSQPGAIQVDAAEVYVAQVNTGQPQRARTVEKIKDLRMR